MSRAVIIGSGHVGSCVAFLLALRGMFDEVVLVDKRSARARAEAEDMMAALPRLGSKTLVRGGDYDDCAEAGIVVLSAAAPVRLGQTRNDMFLKNSQIVSDAVGSCEAAGFRGLYLMVTNPVDLLVHFMVDRLDVPGNRVVGTGTLLDSMRLEDCLRECYLSSNASALALGEHGEGLVVDWARTVVDGAPVPDSDREGLRRAAIDAAYEIMRGKGSTSYGIAESVVLIIERWIARDDQALPLSIPAGGAYGIEGISLALPSSFDGEGRPRVKEVDLSCEVIEALGKAAVDMKESYTSLLESLD